MMSNLTSCISFIFLIFIMTSCTTIYENEDIVITFQYVSEDAKVNTYHDGELDVEVRDNNGIRNYAWTDTCNSIKIAVRNKSDGSPAYDQYRFQVDFGDGTITPQNGFASNDIVHLYEIAQRDGYKAKFRLYNINKPQSIISFEFTFIVQESNICQKLTFNHPHHPPSIIRLNEGSTNTDMQEVAQALKDMDAEIIYSYRRIFKGFAIEYDADIIKDISTHKHVEQISTNQTTEASIWQASDYLQPLSFLNQNIPATNGSGVHIYVIDTALYQHSHFKERIREGIDFVTDNEGNSYHGDSKVKDYCHNHATHVTGIAAATDYGIAPGASIHPVRVLNCKGLSSIARVLAGLDWITEHAEKPAVVNMSLGAWASRHLDDAVINSSKTGIFYVVSAGNISRYSSTKNAYPQNSCEQSPARAGKNQPIMTVGASNRSNEVDNLSLQGACVDIFALGHDVISAGTASANNVIRSSGSSMAVPHIAGAAALYLQHHPNAKPQEVHDYLIEHAIKNKLSKVAENTVNLLYERPRTLDTMKPILSLSSVTVASNGLIRVRGQVADVHGVVSHIRVFDGVREFTNENGAKIHFPHNHDGHGPFNFVWQWQPDNNKPERTLRFVAYDESENTTEITVSVPTEPTSLQ